jgi:hypothetical protein
MLGGLTNWLEMLSNLGFAVRNTTRQTNRLCHCSSPGTLHLVAFEPPTRCKVNNTDFNSDVFLNDQ